MKRRLTALVIGNAAYPAPGALRNPANDANDLAERLERFGFKVLKATNCSNKDMDKRLKSFTASLSDSDVGLFFFAGHGMQIDGVNYLIAVDTDLSSETDAKHMSLSLDKVIDAMAKAPNSTSIIILDACRDNPYERAWNRSAATRGLAPVYAPRGTLIAYATSPGQVASDGHARNGAYTEALLQHIDTPDCSIETMFKRVRNTLSAATGKAQTSWEHTSLSGEFFFNISLGARIDDYSPTALSDRLLVLDEGRASHRIIRDLKILTWNPQNAAAGELTASTVNTLSTDSLFVIGRNLYQAACGSANGPRDYIDNFTLRTMGVGKERRRALLDGMLFEIFFDSNCQLRTSIKSKHFNSVFRLQQHTELSASFAFISECLLEYGDRFYSIPGKKHPLAVDVKLKHDQSESDTVSTVYLAGTSILWLEDSDYANADGQPASFQRLTTDNFELLLSEQMIVPRHLLHVTYSPARRESKSLRFPSGWTTRKNTPVPT